MSERVSIFNPTVGLVAALVAGLGLQGCTGKSEPTTGSTGVKLSMDIRGTTDVAGMRFTFTPVSCADGSVLPGGDVITVEKDLEDILLPGGIPEFEDTPLDGDSEHVFADAFITLAAGCYDIVTTPVTEDGDPSSDCATAHLDNIAVISGETTEVFLINQCTGEGPGAADVVSALNHAPLLETVYYVESKFGLRCEAQEVCATARDTDLDPMEFDWQQITSPALAMAGPRVSSTTDHGDGSVTQCVEFIPQEPGRYDLRITVYDLLHDTTGALMRIEDWLAAEGYPNPSHVALSFPFYSSSHGNAPEPEVCDGVDNDCDFEIDEDAIDVGLECGDPVEGECQPGTTVCVGGGLLCEGYVGPTEEICGNGLDEDCDGADLACPTDGCPPGTVLMCPEALDLVLLEDLSGSFADDIASVLALAPDLHATLAAANADTRCGLASFIDKPISPFGNPGDFVYTQDQALTDDPVALQNALASLSIGNGGDFPESQLEALLLLARNEAAMGFAADTVRYVVLSTDATYHQAGDCASCVPNNGDGVIDANEDYPSVTQVRDALNDANIIPVFAVTAPVISTYQALATQLDIDGSAVTELESDSSNLVSAIIDGLSASCTCEAP